MRRGVSAATNAGAQAPADARASADAAWRVEADSECTQWLGVAPSRPRAAAAWKGGVHAYLTSTDARVFAADSRRPAGTVAAVAPSFAVLVLLAVRELTLWSRIAGWALLSGAVGQLALAAAHTDKVDVRMTLWFFLLQPLALLLVLCPSHLYKFTVSLREARVCVRARDTPESVGEAMDALRPFAHPYPGLPGAGPRRSAEEGCLVVEETSLMDSAWIATAAATAALLVANVVYPIVAGASSALAGWRDAYAGAYWTSVALGAGMAVVALTLLVGVVNDAWSVMRQPALVARRGP